MVGPIPDNYPRLLDPWGHRWGIASRVEEVDHDELARRAAEAMGSG